jgi:hypothetical protein
MWTKLAAQSDKEGWPAAHFLAVLAEHEIADRDRRRIERHLAEARLPVGKTLASFDFDAVPMLSKAQVMALTSGDSWIEKGANLLLFGPPGTGKSHLAAPAPSLRVQSCALRYRVARTGSRARIIRSLDCSIFRRSKAAPPSSPSSRKT